MDDNRTAVLLEILLSQFRQFNEGLEGLRSEVKDLRTEMSQRFDDLQCQINTLSAQNQKEHQQLLQMSRKLRLKSNI